VRTLKGRHIEILQGAMNAAPGPSVPKRTRRGGAAVATADQD
jgi:hypothetical protein